MATGASSQEPNLIRRFLSRRQGRDLREYLTAYLMIAPSMILILTFGIFPVLFAFYVSLHKWRLIRGDFLGLTNYLKAVDTLTFVMAFALAIGVWIGMVILIRRIRRQFAETGVSAWWLALPGALHAATVVAFFRYLWFQLPEFLDIGQKIIGQEKTTELFVRLLKEAFAAETVRPVWLLFAGLALAAAVSAAASYRWRKSMDTLVYQVNFGMAWLAAVLGGGLLWFTFIEIARIYEEAIETGVEPEIWAQVVTISSGVILLILAWFSYRSAGGQTSSRGFWIRILGTMFLMVGGWLLIGEVPMAVAAGDKDLWLGLKVTAYFSLGTVPIQLTIALFLSILLFQKLRGSEFFRIVYFLPYVTPSVAAAAIFKQLFSTRHSSPANQVMQFLGMEPQMWLRESDGIFSMISEGLGFSLPEWAAGPSMALGVIMILSIWTYVGYDTVIYMAGLGNISSEVTEAAQIDGANKWQIFRHITFPLLSPTTYFLSLIAIIGTFKAFNTIWVLRELEALKSTDTFSIVIFTEFFEKLRYGYASALAFVLFAIILGLTFINNKIQGSRVFYG